MTPGPPLDVWKALFDRGSSTREVLDQDVVFCVGICLALQTLV